MKKFSIAIITFSFLFVSVGHAQVFPYVEGFDSYPDNQPLNGDGGLAASPHVYVTAHGLVGNCAEFQMSDTAISRTDTITSPYIGPLTANTVTSFYYRAVTFIGGVPSYYQLRGTDQAVIYVGTNTFNIAAAQYTIDSTDQNTTNGYVKVIVPVPGFLGGYSGRFKIVVNNPDGNNWRLEFDSLVVRDTLPVPPTLRDSVTNVACRGQSTGGIKVVASGTQGPYTYLWSVGGDTTQSITDQPAGIYTVTVTDHEGATAALTDTITQPALALLLDSLSKTPASCYGSNTGSATIYASGGSTPYHYNWSTVPPTHMDSAVDLAAGNYSVTVTDASGCALTATTHISQPATFFTLMSSSTQATSGANGTATVGATGGTGAFSYVWSTNPPQTTATATGLAPGLYEVTVSDGSGCHLVDTVFVAFPAGINETGNNIFSIYPNPASDVVYIKMTGSHSNSYSISVADMSGRIVIVNEASSGMINTSSLSDGIYVLKISTEVGNYTSRFVVQR
jgi:hypothetical protein